jgi:C-terminal processing protease CtpA/Prc
MKYTRLFALMSFLFLALASPYSFAGNKAHLGFGTEVTISGFFSPKLKRVKITEVIPESPAAKAGLFAGDELLEANGRVIAGAPAREMAGTLNAIKPGEHLRLKVKRQDGTFASIDIVAK